MKFFSIFGNFIYTFMCLLRCRLPWWLSDKESACQCRRSGVPSMSQEDNLKTDMATRSSTLTWEISWTEEPGRILFMGLQRVRQNLATTANLLPYILFIFFFRAPFKQMMKLLYLLTLSLHFAFILTSLFISAAFW